MVLYSTLVAVELEFIFIVSEFLFLFLRRLDWFETINPSLKINSLASSQWQHITVLPMAVVDQMTQKAAVFTSNSRDL